MELSNGLRIQAEAVAKEIFEEFGRNICDCDDDVIIAWLDENHPGIMYDPVLQVINEMIDDYDFDEDEENEEDKPEYNAYDICREICDYYDNPSWIGERDIESYLDKYYEDMSYEDRWFVYDRMEKFIDGIDPYRSLEDEEDEDDEEWSDEENKD